MDTVNLTYDFANNEGRLAFVKTDWPDYNGASISQIHKLYYGDYLNSAGETESVLLKVRQSTDIEKKLLEDIKITRNCNQCPVYDELENEFNNMTLQSKEVK